MSQATITRFFNSRKRPAVDDIVTTKSKKLLVDDQIKSCKTITKPTTCVVSRQFYREDLKPTSVNYLEDNSDAHKDAPTQPSKSPERTVQPSVAFAKKLSNVAKNSVGNIETVSTARKELSLGDIRKKLASSSRLAELRASADRISRGIQQLKETSDKRNLKEFKSIDVEVPVSPSKKLLAQNDLLSPKKQILEGVSDRPLISPRKVFVSPVKSPSKEPAYIRHASLATSITSLPLPHHYRFLAEIFRGMETVVSLLYNRNEKITFNKLKPSVQEMLKRNFTEKHLAQIKHLVPDFYNFEVQKVKNFTTSAQKEAYELIITPNIPSSMKIMNPSVLLERRRFFFDTLLQLVKKHHAQYLATLDPPMMIPDDKLTRWHPEFEIEKIPEVESAKLPELPENEKYSTAQDVLAKARELFKCNTRMDRALAKLAEARARGLTDQEKAVTGFNDDKTKTAVTQTVRPSTANVTILNPALRNLPASLLEKVKAKQAAKALEAMTRSNEHEEKYHIYRRLPDLARTLRNIYVTERKNVLALNIILSKLGSSFKSNVSAGDLERDIKLLAEESPDFVKLHDLRNATFLKLNKNSDLNKIITKLNEQADKYKSD